MSTFLCEQPTADKRNFIRCAGNFSQCARDFINKQEKKFLWNFFSSFLVSSLHHLSLLVFCVFISLSRADDSAESFNEINLKTLSSSFLSSQLQCTSNIHEIYRQSEERFIEEIRPKILATGTSSMNMYHSVLDGESLTDPNVGMTQYKGNYIHTHRTVQEMWS